MQSFRKQKNTQTTRSRVAKATHLMKESKLLGDGNCVRRLLQETTLLPPPTRRGRWGRPDVTGRPRCRRGASLSWRRDGTASFITRIGVFLTAAHFVPKCLLVACELPSERGVSSEPCAELVPSVFCVEALAMLVTRAIFLFGLRGNPLQQQLLRRVLGILVSVQRGDSRFHSVRDMATLDPEVSY